MLRECRIALGQSQAAFAAMLGASPESYRTWDAGRRATPLKILARARALATHRDEAPTLRRAIRLGRACHLTQGGTTSVCPADGAVGSGAAHAPSPS